MNQTPAATAQGLFPSPVAAKLQGLLRKLNPDATAKADPIPQAFPVPVTEEPAVPKNPGKTATAKEPAAATPKRVKSRSREDLEKEVSELMLNLGMNPAAPEKPPQWLQAQPSAPAAAASAVGQAVRPARPSRRCQGRNGAEQPASPPNAARWPERPEIENAAQSGCDSRSAMRDGENPASKSTTPPRNGDANPSFK